MWLEIFCDVVAESDVCHRSVERSVDHGGIEMRAPWIVGTDDRVWLSVVCKILAANVD